MLHGGGRWLEDMRMLVNDEGLSPLQSTVWGERKGRLL